MTPASIIECALRVQFTLQGLNLPPDLPAHIQTTLEQVRTDSRRNANAVCCMMLVARTVARAAVGNNAPFFRVLAETGSKTFKRYHEHAVISPCSDPHNGRVFYGYVCVMPLQGVTFTIRATYANEGYIAAQLSAVDPQGERHTVLWRLPPTPETNPTVQPKTLGYILRRHTYTL